ncbi:MAG: selenium cofactor biosynthesis protein YqeC [Chloroflexota bacterium]
MLISLKQALRVTNSACVAFIGAGGKTTTLFQLAREMAKETPVIVSASSHLGAWQTALADQHITALSTDDLHDLENNLSDVTLITGDFVSGRTTPLEADMLDWLNAFCKRHTLPLLIEADGSRQKPLKAWAEHEPPIPTFVDQVVQVVGLTGIGKPLSDSVVHRAEIFARLSSLKMDEAITPDALLQVITHKEGGLKNIPPNARKCILLNQADTAELQSIAHGITKPLLSNYHSVIVSSLAQESVFAVHEAIAGIILAAGGSTRFGKPKQLLDWKGQPFVRAVAQTALEAGLAPVVVVTGANSEQVEAAVKDLNVVIVKNDEWQSGQGSSIKAGINALTSAHLPLGDGIGGAIFLLADQPQITTSIIQALVEKHAEGLYPIIAPLVLDQRANPALFDRVTFDDLMNIAGDVGGRAIFHKYHVEYLPWHDDRMLLDVDTPEHYQRLISDETL